MKIPYAAPPAALRRILGPEAFDYFERLHGLVQGLGDRGEEIGRLDLRNLGIRSAKAGSLLGVENDGVHAKPIDPFVENLRSQSAGFLQATADGRISAAPVDIEGTVTNLIRQEFAAAEVADGEITPGELGGSTAGGLPAAELDLRRYALLVA